MENSPREQPMIDWYWSKIRGTLIREFLAVKAGENQSRRRMDAVIILGGPHVEIDCNDVGDDTLEGKDIIVVQAKAKRLGMYLMGQALFSRDLMKAFNPASVKSVALCTVSDDVLGPMLEAYEGIEVVIMPSDVVTAFCSWCLQKGKHDLDRTHWYTKNEYVCRSCEGVVVVCRYCKEMACGQLTEQQVAKRESQAGKEGISWVKGLGDNWKNECCAQHDGTIPSGFKMAKKRIARLDQYAKFLKPEHVNMKKVGTIAAGALTTAGVVALTATTGGGGAAVAVAAGKMGLLGAAGTGTAISTLGGAALTSASLAAIGGSVATGTAVIAAVGSGLGGAYGASVANQYVGEDKSFEIHKVHRRGPGGWDKTVFVNGFLKQKDVDFEEWMVGHRACFPEEHLYGVTWASRDLYELGYVLGSGAATEIAKKLFIRIGKGGNKKFNPFALVITTLGLLGNPWHVCMVRAAKTGAVLADAISRSKETGYTLVGHSLGCRVIYYALQALSSRSDTKVNDVILLGGAVGKNDPAGWKIATNRISGTLYNCYSEHDGILSALYRIANANLSYPIGISPIPGRNAKIKNVDCSKFIQGASAHMIWKERYEDVLRRIYK